jgi:hypothetical protein
MIINMDNFLINHNQPIIHLNHYFINPKHLLIIFLTYSFNLSYAF